MHNHNWETKLEETSQLFIEKNRFRGGFCTRTEVGSL